MLAGAIMKVRRNTDGFEWLIIAPLLPKQAEKQVAGG
jgi:hypothetical protein